MKLSEYPINGRVKPPFPKFQALEKIRNVAFSILAIEKARLRKAWLSRYNFGFVPDRDLNPDLRHRTSSALSIKLCGPPVASTTGFLFSINPQHHNVVSFLKMKNILVRPQIYNKFTHHNKYKNDFFF